MSKAGVIPPTGFSECGRRRGQKRKQGGVGTEERAGLFWVFQGPESLGYGDMCELITGARVTVTIPEGHSQWELGKVTEEAEDTPHPPSLPLGEDVTFSMRCSLHHCCGLDLPDSVLEGALRRPSGPLSYGSVCFVHPYPCRLPLTHLHTLCPPPVYLDPPNHRDVPLPEACPALPSPACRDHVPSLNPVASIGCPGPWACGFHPCGGLVCVLSPKKDTLKS